MAVPWLCVARPATQAAPLRCAFSDAMDQPPGRHLLPERAKAPSVRLACACSWLQATLFVRRCSCAVVRAPLFVRRSPRPFFACQTQQLDQKPPVNLRTVLSACAACAVLMLVALAAAIAFGGPTRPQPMLSISNPFRNVDYSALPPLSHYAARDGTQLAYRRYAPAGGAAARGSVVLVHGSSANSQSVHPLAQSLAGAGFAVYALDIRGHGDSGPHGDIAYIGQLDDDLQDFMGGVRPPRRARWRASPRAAALPSAWPAERAGAVRQLPVPAPTPAAAPPASGPMPAAGGGRRAARGRADPAQPHRRHALQPPAGGGLRRRQCIRCRAGRHLFLCHGDEFPARRSLPDDIRAIREPAAVLAGVDDEVFLAARFARLRRSRTARHPRHAGAGQRAHRPDAGCASARGRRRRGGKARRRDGPMPASASQPPPPSASAPTSTGAAALTALTALTAQRVQAGHRNAPRRARGTGQRLAAAAHLGCGQLAQSAGNLLHHHAAHLLAQCTRRRPGNAARPPAAVVEAAGHARLVEEAPKPAREQFMFLGRRIGTRRHRMRGLPLPAKRPAHRSATGCRGPAERIQQIPDLLEIAGTAVALEHPCPAAVRNHCPDRRHRSLLHVGVATATSIGAAGSRRAVLRHPRRPRPRRCAGRRSG